MPKKIIIGVIVCLVLLAVSSLAVSGIDKKKKDDLFRQVELFSDSLAIIDSEYADEVDSKKMIYGAISGMVASLDSHSQFMDPEAYNELKSETEGHFGGLGIEITVKDGLLTVITPIEDTPAWKAGIKAGDRIVKINQELTKDMTLFDAVKKMRGTPGEAVNLTILRESEKKVLEFKVIRDVIKIKDIKDARVLEGGIGYIRLVEFRENTPVEFRTAWEKLKKQGANALILDLRNNPGGLLESAVSVTEEFVEDGKKIVYTKGRKKEQNLEFVSKNKKADLGSPMVVLINDGSASGSEIFAGALQDYKRAIIIGIKSFGKGSVQTVIPLSDGSALRLTTSKYFTPSGKLIHGNGVMPDIVVEEGKIELVNKEDPFGIQDLKDKPNDAKIDKQFDYKSDNQLMRAVDVLKAVKIYEGKKGN